ncbi:MAG: 6-carboxytetrahydropterin synthase [Eubacteriales bacterium]
MYQYGYRFFYRFNAKHTMRPGVIEGYHPHSFCISVSVSGDSSDYQTFNQCNALLDEFFKQFVGMDLNTIVGLEGKLPTVENLATFFYDETLSRVEELSLRLEEIEFGDNPLSSVLVSDRLFESNVGKPIDDEKYQRYCDILFN